MHYVVTEYIIIRSLLVKHFSELYSSNGGLKEFTIPDHQEAILTGGTKLADAVPSHSVGEDLSDGILVDAGDGGVLTAYLGMPIQVIKCFHGTIRRQEWREQDGEME